MSTVVFAKAVGPGRLQVPLDDGSSGVIDVPDLLWAEMFEPLEDPALFATERADPVFGAVVFDNGADIGLEALLERLRRSPVGA